MIVTVPTALEDALWQAARRRLPAAALAGAVLHQAVIDRSRRYTSERARLDEPRGGGAAAADLAARALFFTVADAAKIRVPLAELSGRGRLATGELRVLDLGAGAGAMTLGALAFAAEHGVRRLHVHAVDRDAAALAILADAARILAAALAVELTLETSAGDLAAEPARRGAARLPVAPTGGAAAGWDVVIAGSVVNELAAVAAQRLLSDALASVSPDGSVVIIEPALRDTSRALHRLRDWVIGEGLATVFAPCTRAIAPCPALADERDWCHEDRATQLPPQALRIAVATGLRTHGLKFAYLVLRRDGATLVDAPPGRHALRVVSQLERAKGKETCFACGALGRVELRLLRRHRTDDNRAFERAHRGDVLVTAATGEITAADEVLRLEPAMPA